MEPHIREDAIENTTNNDPPLLQEQVPADDYSNSAIKLSPVLKDEPDELSSDDSFSNESRKDSFNKSMSSISSDWTAIKYQLRTNFNSLAEKTKKKLIQRSLIAVDNVLENIAPGQVSQLKKSITEPSSYNSEVSWALQNAVSSASSVNTKVQLLSILCGKSDDTYEFTIAQMLEKLALMDLNLTTMDVMTRSPAMKELTKQNKSGAAQLLG